MSKPETEHTTAPTNWPTEARAPGEFERKIRELRDDGHHKAPDWGEMLVFPDSATRIAMGLKHGLDHPDFDIRMQNINKFRKTQDYMRFRVFKPKYV